jgi:hypothetical protein
MSDLIAALTIMVKYADKQNPTFCGHDVMIVDLDPAVVSDDDRGELKHLGFINGSHESSGGEPCFYSYRFGKC